MGQNTDLALESYRGLSEARELTGVISEEYYDSDAAATVSKTKIISAEAAEKLGKPKGVYITIECDRPLSEYLGDIAAQQRVVLLSECLSEVCKASDETLVLGLGNRDITPDALGPLTAERVFATRHIKRYASELFGFGMSQVSAVSAGVMAKTGIESQEIAASLCKAVSPAQVIVCDALACAEPSHMGRTIQLCSTGISPGSGVENARAELSERFLGVPTAAIGIPTVSRMMSDDTRFDSLMVTPKQIDKLIKAGAELISAAINSYLHPELTSSEINSILW
ncbi:MAG: GPR endopeptidase [Ruminococcus sp.]|nr:GPR endopeptidase [Ruminococcus sp.]